MIMTARAAVPNMLSKAYSKLPRENSVIVVMKALLWKDKHKLVQEWFAYCEYTGLTLKMYTGLNT